METSEGFRRNLTIYEGKVPYMYLDAKRLLTVGIGHLTEKFMLNDLPFVLKSNLTKAATPEEKQAEFDRVSAATTPVYITGGKNKWYHDNITLILKEDDINAIFDKDVKLAESSVKSIHPDFYSYPAGARYAILDIVFNVGAGKFKGWTNFNDSVSLRDFKTAAGHSHRKAPVSEDRNHYVKRLLLAAFDEEKQNPKQESEAEKNTMTARHTPHHKKKRGEANPAPVHQPAVRVVQPPGAQAPAAKTFKHYKHARNSHPATAHRTGHHR